MKLPDTLWTRFREAFLAAIDDLAAGIIADAVEAALLAGLRFDVEALGRATADFVSEYEDALWSTIRDTTQKHIDEAVAAFDAGAIGKDELDARVAGIFSPERAEMIAITETTRLHTEGTLLAASAASNQEPLVQFLTVRDPFVDPEICAPLDGEVYSVSEAPTPPLHVNCRCFLAPFVPGLTDDLAA